MTKKSSTPAIRFKGFTDTWEQRELSDLIIEYKETVDSDCTLPVLTSSKTEGVVLQEEHFGRVQNHDITGYNILPRNYCTYRNRSDGVDFTFNINRCCDKGIISKFYPVFYGDNSDIFFISMVLNYCDEVVREIAYTCTGTGQKVLSFLDLQKMNIRVPSYDEQKKISQYFEQLDNLITLHQRECDKLTNVKKSMLEKMFPKNGSNVPEIRFKGFTEAWEQRKVREITDRYDNLRIPVAASLRIAGTTPYYGANGIQDYVEGYTHDGEFILVAEDGANDLKNYPVKCVKGRIWVNNHAHVLQGKCACADNQFLAYAISQADIESLLVGGGRAKLNAETLMDIELLLPSKDEQRQIGSYLARLDNLITLHQCKRIILLRFLFISYTMQVLQIRCV